jgi:hypothetical protein
MKPLYRVLAVFAPDSVVPLRNQVAKWATVMTKRNTAIHAATSLVLNHVGISAFIDFLPVHNPHRNRSALSYLSIGSF